jgi:VWFA-related protein
MNRVVTLVSCALICVPVLIFDRVAGQAPPTPVEGSFKGGASEVLLDVVVRDKHGKSITDLSQSDFEILDNGTAKKIASFRLVSGKQAISGGGARADLDPLRQIRLITLIFQVSDLQSRKLSRDAAIDLLKTELPQNVYMAVLTIDHNLEALQSFTNDRALLRKAIDRATSADSTDFTSDTNRVRDELQQIVGPNVTGANSLQGQVSNMSSGATGATGPGGAPNPSMVANQLMAQMMLNMLQAQEGMVTAEAGRASIYALLQAVRDQYRLPGRKVVLYFTPGFTIPQGMEEPFRSVISVANRSNVSFYPIDARGLTIGAQNSAAVSQMQGAAQASKDQMTSLGGTPVTREQAQVFDNVVNSSRANTQNTLSMLAGETGGFLIANTNDFRAPLRKIAEDLETYYEITYDPQIEKFDGSFRKITVKLDRPDLKVQSRSGYFALPANISGGAPVLHTYEVPLLKALDRTPLPKDFEFRETAMHFRAGADKALCELGLDVPFENLTLKQNPASGQYEGRLSYVVLVKNPAGDVLKKFQNEIPLKVPAEKLDAFKTSHFVYTEHFDLPPGRYILAAAVLDQESSKTSAKKVMFVMPKPSEGLGISSVVIVKRIRDIDSNTTTADPFYMDNKLVSPDLGGVVKKAGIDGVPFYMVIYPDAAKSADPQLVMEFSRDGQVLGRGSPTLGARDKDGRIQYIATAPVGQLQPGDYRIRFVVKQGDETAEESVAFKLE